MSMMDSIFDGRLYPGEQILSKEPEYTNANQEVDRIMVELETKLEKAEYDLVDKAMDCLSAAQDVQNKEFFRCGFATGLLLMKEAGECSSVSDALLQECRAKVEKYYGTD
ncbi:MAG: hypothetical protein LUF27_05070 [Lachnospiraceae bacterium]|nr:hypothetical protein [Lachnospiraceae bacterium]